MSNHLRRAQQYRRKSEECVAMAKAAISNKARARHYADADRYLSLAEAEARRGSRSGGWLRDRLSSLFQPDGPRSQVAR
jgi:hypothetical protein